MNTTRRIFAWLLVAWMGIVLHAGIANAHTMPISEATLRLDKSAEHYALIVPRSTTLGDARAIFGEDFTLDESKGGWLRIVRYKYDAFEFSARTIAKDETDNDDLKISGYDVESRSLRTPSNFHVGAPYQKVVDKYGEGKKFVSDGETQYIYSFPGRSLSFTVDAKGKITQISFRTEV